MSGLLSEAVSIAEGAGRVIMAIYSQEDFGTTFKENKSPLTIADTAAHEFILKALQALIPSYPVLSEESLDISYETRKKWDTFWLVDPLDGTKEFIKRTGEFAVNIALMKKNKPVLGVIHIPAKGDTYAAESGHGAFKQNRDGERESIHIDGEIKELPRVILSRSHQGAEMQTILNRLGDYDSLTSGSAIKFCLVAEGSAHIYARLWPSMEWDTAAGECILKEAGGVMRGLDNQSLEYNKEDLKNPSFIASANEQFFLKCLGL